VRWAIFRVTNALLLLLLLLFGQKCFDTFRGFNEEKSAFSLSRFPREKLDDKRITTTTAAELRLSRLFTTSVLPTPGVSPPPPPFRDNIA